MPLFSCFYWPAPSLPHVHTLSTQQTEIHKNDKMVEKEVSLQLHVKMSDQQEKKEDKRKEEREAGGRLFFRRDIFKETVMQEESQSLLANNDSD